MRALSFYVDNELFAVDVDCVQKIARKINITHVPAAPDAITGIINLKGRVITVFSLYDLLGRGSSLYKKTPYTDRRKPQAADILNKKPVNNGAAVIVNIIVFKSNSDTDDQMGLIMDRPGILIDIDDELIRQPSLAAGTEESYCISGVAELDNTLYRIINIDSIIDKYKNIGGKTAENN
ncbi:MAG: chemotaxis protein CheW [Treponema sp.]|nr:chemotaxis protein CheW [Treponema sp.]